MKKHGVAVRIDENIGVEFINMQRMTESEKNLDDISSVSAN